MNQSAMFKIEQEDFKVEYGLGGPFEARAFGEEIEEIDKKIDAEYSELSEIDSEISRLTNHADAFDYKLAVASGVIAGLIDSFWVGEFDFKRGKAWSNKKVNEFVMETAKRQGYEEEETKGLKGAIKYLEDKFPVPSDNVWKGEGAKISAKSHHLDDMAHHPTPVGLFFSILTQFTKKGYFQNRDGEFFAFSLDENGEGLVGNNFSAKIYAGTINWFFHLVSDMSGSNKTAGVGMGIPGPIVSMVKEFSSIPGVDKTKLPGKVNEAFVKDRFDLRSELAVWHELGRQAVPVIFNEIFVRALYFFRRLCVELRERGEDSIDWKKTLPFKNRTIARMLTISSGTFVAVDLGDAAMRAAVASKGNKAVAGKEFLLRVNFVGVGRFSVAVFVDSYMGYKKSKFRDERAILLCGHLYLINAKVFYFQAGMWVASRSTYEAIREVSIIAESSAKAVLFSWEENRKSLARISGFLEQAEERNPDLQVDINNILGWE